MESENLKERDHLRGIVVDRRIIMKLILRKKVVRMLTGFNGLRIGPSDGVL
jgi:hypothetical protein